jgi:hypothetical protein
MNKFSLKIKKIHITRNEVFDKLFNAIIFGYFNPGENLLKESFRKKMF